MSDTPPDPAKLSALGKRLDEVQRRREAASKPPSPTTMGIAFRFSTEMIAALVVGGGMGWGIDWLFGTRPIFIVVMFILGAAAGIRNVVMAAKELNAQMAVNSTAPATDEDED